VESILKSDIFFFISSVATVVLTILVSILLFYFIKAGKNLYMLSEVLKDGLKYSEEFVQDLKDRLEDNIVFRIFFPASRKKRKATVKNEDNKK
jgi:hypothetical protein